MLKLIKKLWGPGMSTRERLEQADQMNRRLQRLLLESERKLAAIKKYVRPNAEVWCPTCKALTRLVQRPGRAQECMSCGNIFCVHMGGFPIKLANILYGTGTTGGSW